MHKQYLVNFVQFLLKEKISVTTTAAPLTTTHQSDSHSLSQLSPEELAAYATRLRAQFQQEKQAQQVPVSLFVF
jgi:hypothetical protein